MILFSNNKTLCNLLVLVTFFVLLFGVNHSVSAQETMSIEDLVKCLSDGKLQVETKAVPYQLIGDFNDDKVKDVAVIVSLSDTVENISKFVKIENPYARAWGKEVNTELLALFIIHGKGKGWQFAQKSSVLFLGNNSALIFQKSRLSEFGDKGNNWEVEKDRNGKVNLLFGTEASEGILKWNGKRYTWTETQP